MKMNAFEAACALIRTLRNKGFIGLFAGGWVRDFIMERASSDIDIVTDANPEQLQAIFPHTLPIGIAFGIIMVKLHGHTFEVATFRKDREYVDGRRPIGIDKADAYEDAQRRDFTINGLYYDPIEERIIDYVDGQKDLFARVVKAIGDPNQRFFEDRLRMIRAVRFACRFDFAIEETTFCAIQRHAHSLFPAVAIERVWHEIEKMAEDGSLFKAFSLMHTLGILEVIFPGILHENLATLGPRLETLCQIVPCAALLVPFFPGYDATAWRHFAEKWKRPNKEKKLIELTAKMLEPRTKSRFEWVQFFAAEEAPLIEPLLLVMNPQEGLLKIKKELTAHIQRYAQKAHLVVAADIIDRFPQNQLGKWLMLAQQISIEKNLHTKEEVLSVLYSL